MSAPTKLCRVCGRRIEWRRKWARCWDEVSTCSAACRKRGVRAIDRRLEEAILHLLDARARGATICPSEAARAVAEGRWRDHMEDARRAARRLVAEGAVSVMQRGRVVDASEAKGPIRIRRER